MGFWEKAKSSSPSVLAAVWFCGVAVAFVMSNFWNISQKQRKKLWKIKEKTVQGQAKKSRWLRRDLEAGQMVALWVDAIPANIPFDSLELAGLRSVKTLPRLKFQQHLWTTWLFWLTCFDLQPSLAFSLWPSLGSSSAWPRRQAQRCGQGRFSKYFSFKL